MVANYVSASRLARRSIREFPECSLGGVGKGSSSPRRRVRGPDGGRRARPDWCRETRRATHVGSASGVGVIVLGSAVTVFEGLDEFAAAKGSQFGPTEWLTISQERVNLFADATDVFLSVTATPEKAAG